MKTIILAACLFLTLPASADEACDSHVAADFAAPGASGHILHLDAEQCYHEAEVIEGYGSAEDNYRAATGEDVPHEAEHVTVTV